MFVELVRPVPKSQRRWKTKAGVTKRIRIGEKADVPKHVIELNPECFAEVKKQ